MKVTATTTGSLLGPHSNFGPVANHIRHTVQSAATLHRLQEELAAELAAVTTSERGVDPEFRRDALERAVRRIWGATQ